MDYIAQMKSDSSRTRCAKSDETPKVCYRNMAPNKGWHLAQPEN